MRDLVTFCWSHFPSVELYVSTDADPSEEAAATLRPSSWGAKATLFTEALCKLESEVYTCILPQSLSVQHVPRHDVPGHN